MAKFDLKSFEQKIGEVIGKAAKLSPKDQVTWLKKSSEKIILPAEIEKKLSISRKIGQPLRIKFGIDPTTKDIHLGHAVPLLLLRKFQDLGHQVFLVFGDFTATIGDPSHRVKARPILTAEQIKENVKTYKRQAGKILDIKKADIHFNSEWLDDISLRKFFGYLGLQTVSSGFEREDFRKRKSITRAELLYATLQALDSIELKIDIEIGGVDQLLNFIEARELMKKVDLPPQSIITTPLLWGLSGHEKMSKSLRNYIGLSEQVKDIYGKTMSIPDDHMPQYFKLLTDLSIKDWSELALAIKKEEVHPKEVKKLLARKITALLCPDSKLVERAEKSFERVFSDKKAPRQVPTIKLSRGQIKDLADLVVATKKITSRSEAKRLIKAGAVSLTTGEGEKVLSTLVASLKKNDFLLRIGKHVFVKIAWTQ